MLVLNFRFSGLSTSPLLCSVKRPIILAEQDSAWYHRNARVKVAERRQTSYLDVLHTPAATIADTLATGDADAHWKNLGHIL